MTDADLPQIKREAARHYVRKRHSLRMAVRLGLISAAEVRQRRSEIIEHKTTWRAARALLTTYQE